MFPERMDSMMYHTPALNVVELQSRAVEIPLIKGKSSGMGDNEVEDLKKTLKPIDVECVVIGALESVYQKRRVDRVCDEIGLKAFAPFWHSNLEKHLRETIDLGFEVIFVGVAALGLNEKWLGRKLDYRALQELKELHEKYKVNLGGEGGEYETLVCDGPDFKLRIRLLKTIPIWDNKTGSGYLEINKAELVPKKGTG
jgi:predicted ATP pyrophosphatase (TIGR00289 family)